MPPETRKVPLELLPAKDRAAFKEANKLYGDRKYAKAAKALDVLIKKYPTCIELHSLQCLVLRNVPERKAEALAEIKLALRLDIRSSVAWHAKGSYHRMENDLSMAIAAFKQAVFNSPTTQQLMTDLASCLLITRQYDQFLKTSEDLLHAFQNEKRFYFGVVFARHMAGLPGEAAEMLLKWWELPPEVLGDTTVQINTELRLYLVRLLEEAGEFQRAFSHISTALALEADFKEPLAGHILLGRLNLRLRNYSQAADTYRKLIALIPENTDFLLGYLLAHPELHSVLPNPFTPEGECLKPFYPDILTDCGVRNADWLSFIVYKRQGVDRFGRRVVNGRTESFWYKGGAWEHLYCSDLHVTPEQETRVLQIVDDLMKFTGKVTCDAITALAIPFCRIEDSFKRQVKRLLEPRFRKASPAVFAMMKTLRGADDERLRWLHEVVTALVEELSTEHPLLKYLGEALEAEHLMYVARRTEEAHELIQKVVKAVPTFAEIVEVKSQLETYAGRLKDAARTLNGARLMDQADRYLNDRTVKAYLEIDESSEAETMARCFQAASELKDKGVPLDIQNMSFDAALVESHLRQGNWRQAGARLDRMWNRIQELRIESANFYVFAMRRGALRGFTDYQRLLTRLPEQRFMIKAGLRFVELLVALHDKLIQFKPAAEEGVMPNYAVPLDLSTDTKPWITRATDILTLLRDETREGNYQSNAKLYKFFMREDTRDLKTAERALRNLWKLSNCQLGHPKLLPYLIHAAVVGSAEFGEILREIYGEDKSIESLIKELKDELSARAKSDLLKDRIAVIKAWELFGRGCYLGGVVEDWVRICEEHIRAGETISLRDAPISLLRAGRRLRWLMMGVGSRECSVDGDKRMDLPGDLERFLSLLH